MFTTRPQQTLQSVPIVRMYGVTAQGAHPRVWLGVWASVMELLKLRLQDGHGGMYYGYANRSRPLSRPLGTPLYALRCDPDICCRYANRPRYKTLFTLCTQ